MDANGNPIKTSYAPQMRDIFDRYGTADGTYASPVINGYVYDYAERSLPFIQDISKYHQYKVVGDFLNIKYYVENCKDPVLKSQVEAAILKYHGGSCDNLTAYIGDIAPAFGNIKGGTQIQFPLTIEQLEGLGLIEEIP